MKLGVSYNVFDGEELLAFSLKAIREAVEHINVVYQTVSNFGNSCAPELKDMLLELRERKLVDELFEYVPDFGRRPDFNEAAKRNLGLQIAKQRGCTHFLSMDCDEFYDRRELAWAREYIEQNGIEASACGVLGHIKEPVFQFQGGTPYVPFIARIFPRSKIRLGSPFPLLTDATRRLNGDRKLFLFKRKFHLFQKEELVMHHMGLVRRNIFGKYQNSTSNDGGAHSQKLLEFARRVRDWRFGEKLIHLHGEEITVVQVENKFNIQIEENDES
jgi:hypothetical protein